VLKLNSLVAALLTASFLWEIAPVMGFATEGGTAAKTYRRPVAKV